MLVRWVAVALVVALAAGPCGAQLSLGPGGVSTPPINLVSVFKFIRDIFMFYFYPNETATVDVEPVLTREDEGTAAQDVTEKVVAMGFDTEGNIVEKLDSGCIEGVEGGCVLEDAASTIPGVLEEKTGSAQVVVGKWPLIYIILNSILFWIFVIIASPYILTGETYGRREDEFDPNTLVDQQDVLLLLSWLLGEASNDTSCLERMVCLTPFKSSRYISVSSMMFNVLNFFQRWLPYSPRIEELLRRLDYVVQDGYDQECQLYHCPNIPEL